MIRKVYVLDDVEVEFRELTAREMSELQKIKISDTWDEQMMVFKKAIIKIDKKTVSENEIEDFICKMSHKNYQLAKVVTNDMNIISADDIDPFLKSAKEII